MIIRVVRHPVRAAFVIRVENAAQNAAQDAELDRIGAVLGLKPYHAGLHREIDFPDRQLDEVARLAAVAGYEIRIHGMSIPEWREDQAQSAKRFMRGSRKAPQQPSSRKAPQQPKFRTRQQYLESVIGKFYEDNENDSGMPLRLPPEIKKLAAELDELRQTDPKTDPREQVWAEAEEILSTQGPQAANRFLEGRGFDPAY